MTKSPKRKYLTTKQKAALLIRQGGRCARCPTELPAPGMIFDHANMLAVSCDNGIANFQALCAPCNALKTHGNGATSYGSDIHAIAKLKRLRGETKTKRKHFDKRYSRRMDGTVVKRKS